MNRWRIAGMTILIALLAGCISYPSTKILVTPIGAAGIHSFAPPERTPDNIRSAQAQSERLAAALKKDERESQR